MPAVAFSRPTGGGPASVTPRWSGKSTVSARSRYASIISGTDEAFTEIFTSVEADLARSRPAPARADSTIASGVTRPPCFSYSFGSRLPPLTPMRIGIPRSLHSCATTLMCSGLRMLPGLRRRHCTPGVERGERHPVLVVDVGHDRHRRAGHDASQPLGRLHLVAGAPDDVGSGRGQRVDLLQRALDVGRLRDRHRLHRDRRAAAHRHLADLHLPGLPPRVRRVADLHQRAATVIRRSGRRCRGRRSTASARRGGAPPRRSAAGGGTRRPCAGGRGATGSARRRRSRCGHRRAGSSGRRLMMPMEMLTTARSSSTSAMLFSAASAPMRATPKIEMGRDSSAGLVGAAAGPGRGHHGALTVAAVVVAHHLVARSHPAHRWRSCPAPAGSATSRSTVVRPPSYTADAGPTVTAGCRCSAARPCGRRGSPRPSRRGSVPTVTWRVRSFAVALAPRSAACRRGGPSRAAGRRRSRRPHGRRSTGSRRRRGSPPLAAAPPLMTSATPQRGAGPPRSSARPQLARHPDEREDDDEQDERLQEVHQRSRRSSPAPASGTTAGGRCGARRPDRSRRGCSSRRCARRRAPG